MPPSKKQKVAATAAADKIKLSYWNGRGLAEVARYILALNGVEYEDDRKGITEDTPPHNFGRVPILHFNGAIVGQSKPINSFLAREYGLLGSTNAETAQIENMIENIGEIGTMWSKIWPYGSSFSETEKESIWKTWFDSPAKCERTQRQLRWILDKLEGLVSADGYCVGKSFTLADFYLYNVLAEHDASLEAKGEPFQNKTKLQAVLKDFPKLSKCIATFGAQQKLKSYLATRPKNDF